MRAKRVKIFFVLICGFCFLSHASEKKSEKNAKSAQSKEDRYENLELFQKVLYFVEQNYVEDVKNKELIYGAIKGMVDTLDPHSSFLPPEIYKNMKIDTSGKFGGIGIEIGIKDSSLSVVSPIEDTPAFKAGIKPGDRIVKINGESAKGLGLEEAVNKMRGAKGTPLTISIWRKGFDKPKDFTIVRAEIKIKNSKSEILEPHFLYLRLASFNERSFDDLKSTINDFEKKQGPIKGMILDLRNNPGGLLDQAVDVTSLFVDEGVVVSTRGKNANFSSSDKDVDIKYAKKGFAHKDFPLAVLVNGSSASASEIVAGALQDHKRAVIMGQPTFGKGSVQTVIELAPDVGLKLTIARYYTPSGRSIQLKGIQPDIILDDFDQQVLDKAKQKILSVREKDLKNHMSQEDTDDEIQMDLATENTSEEKDKNKSSKEKDDFDLKPFVAKKDYQVLQALNYLKSYRLFEIKAAK